MSISSKAAGFLLTEAPFVFCNSDHFLIPDRWSTLFFLLRIAPGIPEQYKAKSMQSEGAREK